MRKNRTILQRIPSANGPDSRKLSLVMIRKENLVSNEGDGSVAHSLMVVLQTFEMFHSHPGGGLVGRTLWFCHSRTINDAFIDPPPYGSSYWVPLVPNIHIYPSLRFHKLIWNGSDFFGITKMIDFKLKQAFIDIKLSFSDGSLTKIHVYIQLVLGRYFGSVSEITHSRSPPEYQRNSVALELVRRRWHFEVTGRCDHHQSTTGKVGKISKCSFMVTRKIFWISILWKSISE